MDTGKSQKGHGGHQENIQLPETEWNLRLGFSPEVPKQPPTPRFSPIPWSRPTLEAEGADWDGRIPQGRGPGFLHNSAGMGLCSRISKLLASPQPPATLVEPRRHWSGCIQDKSISWCNPKEETKLPAENTLYLKTPHNRKGLLRPDCESPLWAEPFHIARLGGEQLLHKTIFGLGRELCSRTVLLPC